jgi:Fe2+ or Zn2+ uptake regulation protein
MTPADAFVLEALARSDRALTAYQLLDRLRAAGLGKEPPIVYRALDFLLTHGFVHRVERPSAYVACLPGADCHPAAFLICSDCRRVTEVPIDPHPEQPRRTRAHRQLHGPRGLGRGGGAVRIVPPRRRQISAQGRCPSSPSCATSLRPGPEDATCLAMDWRMRLPTRDLLLAGVGPRLVLALIVLSLLWAAHAVVTG